MVMANVTNRLRDTDSDGLLSLDWTSIGELVETSAAVRSVVAVIETATQASDDLSTAARSYS